MVYVLAGLLVASWAAQLIRERQTASERRRLLNAALARDAGELVALERIGNEPRRRKRRQDDDDTVATGPLIGAA